MSFFALVVDFRGVVLLKRAEDLVVVGAAEELIDDLMHGGLLLVTREAPAEVVVVFRLRCVKTSGGGEVLVRTTARGVTRPGSGSRSSGSP